MQPPRLGVSACLLRCRIVRIANCLSWQVGHGGRKQEARSLKVTLRIFGYLRPYWRRTIALYVALFTALGIQLTIPIVIGRAIDHGIEGGDKSYLLRAALIIVVLTLVQGIFTFGRTFLSQQLAEKVAFDLRNELYGHLQSLNFSFYDRAQSGQLMARATDDINNIRAMLVMTMRPLVLAVATLIAVSVILFRIDALLAAVALSTMPFLCWYSIRYGVALRPMFLKVQQQFGVMTSALQENVSGNRVVRAFAQEQAENAASKPSWKSCSTPIWSPPGAGRLLIPSPCFSPG